jgi:hypothetical protein
LDFLYARRHSKSRDLRHGIEPYQTASSETVRDKLAKQISNDPRFKIVKPTGKGFVIGGAKAHSA